MPDRQSGTFDIWILEIERNLLTRLTFEPETELGPRWSPDGKQVDLFRGCLRPEQSLSQTGVRRGAAELLFESPNDCYPTDWSPDGR